MVNGGDLLEGPLSWFAIRTMLLGSADDEDWKAVVRETYRLSLLGREGYRSRLVSGARDPSVLKEMSRPHDTPQKRGGVSVPGFGHGVLSLGS